MNSVRNLLSAEHGSSMPDTAELSRVQQVLKRVQQMGRIATAAVAITVGANMPTNSANAAEPDRAAHQVNSGANTSRITSIYSYIEQKNFSYNASALVKEFTLFTDATKFIEEYKPTLEQNMNDPTVNDAVAVMFGDYYNWLVQEYNRLNRSKPGDEQLTLHSTLFEDFGLPEHHGQPLNTSETPVHHYAVVTRLAEPIKVSWTTVGSTVTAAQATHEIEDVKPSMLTATKAADSQINSAAVNQRIHDYIAEKQFSYDAYALLKTVNTYDGFNLFLRGDGKSSGYQAQLVKNMNDELITDAFAVMIGEYYNWILQIANNARSKAGQPALTLESGFVEKLGIPKPLVDKQQSKNFGNQTMNSVEIDLKDKYLVVWGASGDSIINGEVYMEHQIPGNAYSKTASYSSNSDYIASAIKHKQNSNNNSLFVKTD